MKLIRLVIAAAVLTFAAAGCDDNKPAEPSEPPPAQPSAEKEAEPVKEAEPQPEPPVEEGAQWVSDDTHGVKFRVPDDWVIKKGESSTSVTSPDDTITALLVGTQGEGVLSTALESIKAEVQFKELKLEKDKQTIVNGMPGHIAEGSAVLVKEDGDQGIQFLMNAVQAGEKGVALMIFAEAEMYEARKEEVEGIPKTLQKL